MKQKQFGEFLRNPELTDASSIPLFEELVERFPFCQTGQVLYAYNLLKVDSFQYPVQLRRAAAYAGDRKVLKTLIESAKHEIGNQSMAAIPPATDQDTPAVIPLENTLEDSPGRLPDEQFQSADFGAVSQEELDSMPICEYEPEPELTVTWEFPHSIPVIQRKSDVPDGSAYGRMTQEELLAIVKKRLTEINLGHPQVQPGKDDKVVHATSLDPSPDAVSSAASKQFLIDKFIRDEPRISKPHVAFFNPTESAVRSNYDDEEIVSETLAQLYAEQGNIPKAIHIYQKLSLLNQEKSRYFAAQIEKLST